MVGGFTIIIEIYLFPADLITTWPTLDKPVRVTTGALAGGLENKTLIQELTLLSIAPE